MPHDAVAELVGEAVKVAGEIATDKIHKRWGWKGCLTTIVSLALIIVLGLWALGVFSNA